MASAIASKLWVASSSVKIPLGRRRGGTGLCITTKSSYGDTKTQFPKLWAVFNVSLQEVVHYFPARYYRVWSCLYGIKEKPPSRLGPVGERKVKHEKSHLLIFQRSMRLLQNTVFFKEICLFPWGMPVLMDLVHIANRFLLEALSVLYCVG